MALVPFVSLKATWILEEYSMYGRLDLSYDGPAHYLQENFITSTAFMDEALQKQRESS
jgi:hypothetical protein